MWLFLAHLFLPGRVAKPLTDAWKVISHDSERLSCSICPIVRFFRERPLFIPVPELQMKGPKAEVATCGSAVFNGRAVEICGSRTWETWGCEAFRCWNVGVFWSVPSHPSLSPVISDPQPF
jgi:hypothetical protein